MNWRALGLAPKPPPPAIQGGQLLIYRVAGWRRSLYHGAALNQHADYYYHYGYGDQDMWRIALVMTGQRFELPRPGRLRASCVRVPAGDEPLVVHRVQSKWWGKPTDIIDHRFPPRRKQSVPTARRPAGQSGGGRVRRRHSSARAFAPRAIRGGQESSAEPAPSGRVRASPRLAVGHGRRPRMRRRSPRAGALPSGDGRSGLLRARTSRGSRPTTRTASGAAPGRRPDRQDYPAPTWPCARTSSITGRRAGARLGSLGCADGRCAGSC